MESDGMRAWSLTFIVDAHSSWEARGQVSQPTVTASEVHGRGASCNVCASRAPMTRQRGGQHHVHAGLSPLWWAHQEGRGGCRDSG